MGLEAALYFWMHICKRQNSRDQSTRADSGAGIAAGPSVPAVPPFRCHTQYGESRTVKMTLEYWSIYQNVCLNETN